ncbi:MAG: sulfatase [Planctomycetales bacterium]|nr:sulfatase [Planctomycetales bacterium]
MRLFRALPLLTTSLLAVALQFSDSHSTVSHAAERPNVLWLITEDMGPELGCYGTEQVWTPVLDDLARRGVRYSRAFTVTPVCSTSRSGFCTGMYPITIGAHQHRTNADQKQMLPDGVRPVTHWLQDAGYFTANITSMNGKKFGTGKTDWNFKFPGKPFQGDRWEELKQRQPFYAQINFSQSHRGWGAPAKADPAKVTLPPYYPDHPAARKDWAEYLDEITEVDGLIGRVLKQLEADGLADNTIIFMFGDHGRAHMRGKQWCYDSGLRIPMILYIPPTLAQPAGYEPGTVNENLTASIDITATTLALAGLKKPEKMQGQVFLGPQAAEPREYAFASRDRCDMTSFRIRTARDKQYRYIRNFTPDRPLLNINLYKESSYPMIGLMRELHEQGKLDAVQDPLFDMTMPAEELYMIDDDPYEIHNLAESTDPQHQAALKRLRTALDGWIEDAADQGRTAEDPQIGLDIMTAALRGRKQLSLDGLQKIVEQQRDSPGITPFYAEYLRQVQRIIDGTRKADGAKQ